MYWWKRTMNALAMGVMCLSLGCSPALGVEGPSSRVPRGDLADLLLADDLVVEGTILGVDAVMRSPQGGCGLGKWGPTRSWDVRLRVDRVLVGTAEDSSLVVTTLSRYRFPGDNLGPGTRIIAWARPQCTDGWRLWGDFAVISSGGWLIAHHYTGGRLWLRGVPRDEPIPYASLASVVDQQISQNGVVAFNGKDAVALLTVRNIALTGSQLSYECDSLGWVIGSAPAAPRQLEFTLPPECRPEIGIGDSIIVPVPSGFGGDQLAFSTCPRIMRVKYGFVPGYGVPLAFLSWALKRESDGLHALPFISRE